MSCSSTYLATIRATSRCIRPSRRISGPTSRRSWRCGARMIRSSCPRAPKRSSATSPTPSSASSIPGISRWRRMPPRSRRKSAIFSPHKHGRETCINTNDSTTSFSGVDRAANTWPGNWRDRAAGRPASSGNGSEAPIPTSPVCRAKTRSGARGSRTSRVTPPNSARRPAPSPSTWREFVSASATAFQRCFQRQFGAGRAASACDAGPRRGSPLQ